MDVYCLFFKLLPRIMFNITQNLSDHFFYKITHMKHYVKATYFFFVFMHITFIRFL